MRLVFIGIAILVLLVIVVVVTGYFLPVGHTASRERLIAADADSVFAVISQPSHYRDWRPDVSKVELLPDVDGRPSFRETTSSGTITFVFEELSRSQRVVSRIADKNLGFGGSWTYQLDPVQGGTRVQITENGEVYNPIFRFMMRFVMNPHRTIDRYLDNLGRHFSSAAGANS